MFSATFRGLPRSPSVTFVRTVYGRCRIGSREVVGHGCNGTYSYKDDAHYPFPAVRFEENTPYIMSLKIKEKGHWRNLCCEEKKALYRASFCQTFSEFQHPTGMWKFCLGWALIVIGWAFWLMTFYHFYVADELPESCKYENQKLQFRRMLELRVNPIDGLASLWNYDEDNYTSVVPGLVKKEIIHMGIIDDPIDKKKLTDAEMKKEEEKKARK